ncbi:MAG: hypothetical protein FWH35_05805 [Treponema sp.]|nr:hypothetical protein [Treponema sp.]
MEIEIQNLHLISPVYFTPKEESAPFWDTEPELMEETIFCFEVKEEERLNFEPDGEKLLGSLIFCGELPSGNYLFAQKREILSRKEIINMAIEIQQECLWQRLNPGNRFYLRYLFEDGKWVTQVLRPYG